ncbi:DMT family transporter [bacterium]|nr:DMT family transporter [bacterium]
MAVSSASIFIKFAQVEVASIVIAAYRLSLAALILAPIVGIKYRGILKSLPPSVKWLGLASGFLLAIHFAAWIKSLEYTSVTSSVVLVTTTPLWVAIAAPFAIKETISRKVMAGLVLALAGTFVIGMSDICAIVGDQLVCPPFVDIFKGEALLGDFLAILGAWGAAGYVIIGRKLRRSMPVVPYIFLVYGVAAVFLVGMMLIGGEQIWGFSGKIYLYLVLLAVLPQLVGHSIFNWALGFLPAAIVAISLLGEPIGSSILAYFFLAEVPGEIQLMGTVLIFGGILIASSSKQEKQEI